MLWKASEYSSALRTLPSRQVGHRPAHDTCLPRLTRHRRPLDLFINRAGLEKGEGHRSCQLSHEPTPWKAAFQCRILSQAVQQLVNQRIAIVA